MIVATHNISNCHIDVVNDHRQMVGRRTVRAHQNKIFKRLIINVDRPANDIFKTGSAPRYFKTYRPRRFFGLVRSDRFRCEVKAGSVISPSTTRSLSDLTLSL